MLQHIDVRKANAGLNSYFPNHVVPPLTPALSVQIEGMEDELKDLSLELAASIRREMELEDEVDRLHAEGQAVFENQTRRTSDYYSDSATSSVRDLGIESVVNKTQDLERLKRRSQQEKVQLKLDLSGKLQEERALRKTVEDHVRSLEEHIQRVSFAHPVTITDSC